MTKRISSSFEESAELMMQSKFLPKALMKFLLGLTWSVANLNQSLRVLLTKCGLMRCH